MTERFHRVDRDHLQLDVTMQDPKALAKPWTGTLYYELRNDWDLGEISCSGDYLDFNKFESFSFKSRTGLSRKLECGNCRHERYWFHGIH